MPIQMPKIFFYQPKTPLFTRVFSQVQKSFFYLKTTWHSALYLIIPEWFPY